VTQDSDSDVSFESFKSTPEDQDNKVSGTDEKDSFQEEAAQLIKRIS